MLRALALASAVLVIVVSSPPARSDAPRRAVADVGPELWTSLGPTTVVDGQVGLSGRAQEMTGRVTAIKVHPAQPKVWLAGTAAGGIWRTLDGGHTWKAGIMPHAQDDFDPLSLTVAALAFGPGGCAVYAGTGDISSRAHTATGTGLLVSHGETPGAEWHRLPAYLVSEGTPFDWFRTRVVAVISTGGACTRGIPDAHDLWIATLPANPSYYPRESPEGKPKFLGLFRASIVRGKPVIFHPGPPGRFSDLAVDGHGRIYAARITTRGIVAGVLRCVLPCEAASDWRPLKEYPDSKDWSVAKLAVTESGATYASFFGTNQKDVEVFRNDDAGTCIDCIWKSIAFLEPRNAEINRHGRPGYCNWNPARPAPYGGACSHTNVLSVHPKKSGTLYAGGVALWRCTGCDDQGVPPWEDISFITPRPSEQSRPWQIGFWYVQPARPATPRYGIHVDQQAMAWSGDRLIVGNDGGIWSWDTSRKGVTWTNHNFGGLAITQIYRGALDPRRPDVVFAGTQDVGTIRRDGWRWRWTQGGDGKGVVVSHREPALHWATVTDSVLTTGTPLWRTRDGGLTFQRADLGIENASNEHFPPFVQCPDTRGDVLLFGTRTLWKVEDFFNIPTTRAFEAASPPAWRANHLPTRQADITAIAFAKPEQWRPSCARYAFADTDGIVRETTNGGLAWTPAPRPLDPDRTISALAYGPAQELYATISTYATGRGYVFKTDPVVGWKDITPRAAAFDRPFRALAVSDQGTVFAGSDFGVWMSPDEGASWCRLSIDAATPHPPVMDLKIHPVTQDLYAFTFGRGVFRLRGVERAVTACNEALVKPS